MIGMRHILVHWVFEVDLDIVWNAAQGNLVQLKAQVKAILRQMEDSD